MSSSYTLPPFLEKLLPRRYSDQPPSPRSSAPIHSATLSLISSATAAHVLWAEVPGQKKEEVKVEVDDEQKVVFLVGEVETKKEEVEDEKWRRRERSSGKFKRRFKLPEDARVAEITAAMKDGVLKVTIPKEVVPPKTNLRSIEIAA